MEQAKKRGRAFLSVVLSILLAVGGIVLMPSGNEAHAATSAVANPTPKIDIAVSVPADYPGTFLDYKAELEEKLKQEGLNPDEFRITSTAVQIDTTDTSDWYVYDHYADDSMASYNAIVSGLTDAQKAKRPYRVDPFYSSCAQYGSSGPTTVEFQASQQPVINSSGLLKAWKYKNHIWTTKDAAGKASMVFAGYYNNNNSDSWSIDDYMIYPASSDSRRTFSFDVDAKNTHMHATAAAGFLLNAGISGSGDSATIHGYLLLYSFSDAGTDALTGGKGTLYVLKIKSGVNAKKFRVLSSNTAFHSTNLTEVARTTFDLGTQKKARVYVDLQKDKVTVQQQNYNSDGTFANKTNVITNQALEATGYNGFGPLVAGVVSGHGCTKCSAFTFADLEMTYEADAFDSLKSSQFYEDADYKYFINLAGTSNNPSIPDVNDASGQKAFDQGIERLAENKIFYVSNWNDGHVLSSSGVTADNGLYATSSDSVGQIARYIATNYKENVQYNSSVVNIQVDKPLANLVVRAKDTGTSTGEKDVQALTLHLAHLANNEYIDVYVDGTNSVPSTGSTIDGYQLRVFDPNNNVALDTTGDGTAWITSLAELKARTQRFDKTTTQGRWTFELSVRDSSGAVSTACQTFLTVYNDTQVPTVSFKGHGRESKVTITLTDHGYGIDSDGITLLPDQGSGVDSYSINGEPPVQVPDAPHEFSVVKNLSELEIYSVEVWDECGNHEIYQYNTTRVEFLDENNQRLDLRDPQYATYYVPWDMVSGGGEIGELPEVPASGNSLKYPAGWVQYGGKKNGQIIGPNTQLADMLNLTGTSTGTRVITLKPYYTTKTVKLSFDASGGTFAGGATTKEISVAEGSALSQGLLSGNNLPAMTGYVFDGWVMGPGNGQVTASDGTTVVVPAADVADGKAVTTQQAFVNNTDTDVIHLKATWRIGEYDLKFDANGGTLGTLKKRTLQYGANIQRATEYDQADNVYKGSAFPTREGYIFMGWSETRPTELLAPTTTTKVRVNASLTMPASDTGFTVYAVWKKDTSRYIIHFHLDNAADTEDGVESMLNDVSRYASTEPNYPKPMPTATRSGYRFLGWYTKAAGDGDGGTAVIENTPANATAGTEIHLYAHWQAEQVNYNVAYYIKRSAKDGDYVRLSTTPHGAITESMVTLPAEDRIDKLTPTGQYAGTYWFNPNPTGVTTNYTETLKVKGDGSTRFNLYYDRVLTVTTSANEGGTITSSFTKNEGETAQVNWTVNEGYQVKSVLVDGQVRDDLKAGGTCDFDGQPITDNRSVRVVFEKIPETPSGSGGSGGSGGTVTPPARKAYTVSTQIVGCGSGAGCSITPTAVYTAGSTATVDWTLCGACTVSKIEVDGEVVADAQNGPIATSTLSFTGIAADHSVVVTMADSGRPTLGGTGSTPANDGYYTITVNRYGGDEKFITSSTRTVPYASAARDKWEFTWDEGESEYRIAEIRVNNGAAGVGGAVYGGEGGLPLPAGKAITLGNRAPRNYVVDVYLSKELNKPEDPTSGYKVPDDLGKSDEWIKVTTEIVGGAGQITGNTVAKKEEAAEHTVTYKLDNKDNYSASDYAYYKVEKVLVNGQPAESITDGSCTVNMDESEGEVTVKLTQDADVKVVVEPVTCRVQTLAVTADKDGNVNPVTTAGGTLATSRNIGLYGNFVNLTAAPRFGYRIGAVEVLSKLGKVTARYSFKADGTVEVTDYSTDAALSASSYSISDVPRLANGVFANGEALADDATPLASLAQLLGVEQAWADEAPAPSLNGSGAKQNVYLFGTVDTVLTETPQLDDENNLSMVVRNVTEDQSVVVYFVADETNDTTVGTVVESRPDDLCMVSAHVKGAPGAGVEGGGYVTKGSNADLAVVVPAGYKIVSVNNEAVPDDPSRPENGSYSYNIRLTNVQGDTDVEVVMAPVVRPDNPVLPSGFGDTYTITTTLRGYGALSITPTTTVSAGSNHQVSWAVQSTASPQAEGAQPGEPIIVKVELGSTAAKRVGDKFYFGDELVSTTHGGSLGFANIADNYSVTVTSVIMNEDTDGDGEPDRNVDRDGNGFPDINVDTNGDGLPDLNVEVKDPDGKIIVLNKDTDDDDEPDVNIVDADGDGKPDNVDPAANPAPLPNVNIDTDGNGEPDLNVDTTGDGKPDTNIVDADGDGKPDGVNPNNPTPPAPNVNVPGVDPNDPDKKLILNQDTDGDGKPDVNIVKPDPTDPSKTIIINKDVDGDGIPDINIDTDKDGVPDVNVDTNGDNVPDKNVDTDGTGEWKPSSQGGNADGIWKPDLLIDTGDGLGPVHTDRTDPIDENGNGVDDRWEPNDPSNYDWANDGLKPSDQPGNSDQPGTGDQPGNSDQPGTGDEPGNGLLPGGNDGDNNGAGNGSGNGAGNGSGSNGGSNNNPLAVTGDGTSGTTGTAWNPLLSQTGQNLSQTADSNLPTILMVGAAFVVSSLIVAAARRRRRGDDA